MFEDIKDDDGAMVKVIAIKRRHLAGLVEAEALAKEALEKSDLGLKFGALALEKKTFEAGLKTAEMEFKHNLVELFEDNGEKRYQGAHVIERTVVEYDEELAFKWVMARGMHEVLSLKAGPLNTALKKFSDTPSQLIIDEKPVAKFLKIHSVRIDGDLSEFLADDADGGGDE